MLILFLCCVQNSFKLQKVNCGGNMLLFVKNKNKKARGRRSSHAPLQFNIQLENKFDNGPS